MRQVTLYERHVMRDRLGGAVKDLMAEFDLPEQTGDFGAYLIAELMSLAAMLGQKIDRETFLKACAISYDEGQDV